MLVSYMPLATIVINFLTLRFWQLQRLNTDNSRAHTRIWLPQQLRNTPDARRTLRGDQKPFDHSRRRRAQP